MNGKYSMTFVESSRAEKGSILRRLVGGEPPWLDSDNRPSLGWIVWLLEDVLTHYEEKGGSESEAKEVWQAFDDLFSQRPDYAFWRLLACPAFFLMGKRKYLSPRTSRQFKVSESASP